MRLSEVILNNENMRVYKEGEFYNVGFLKSNIKDCITFVEDEKYLNKLKDTVTCIICTEELKDKVTGDIGILVSSNPRRLFFQIHNNLCKNQNSNLFKTQIGKDCIIGKRAFVSETNVIIGNKVVIEDGAHIKENVIIGDNCVIRSGVIIGGMGFQFDKGNNNEFVAHGGGVILKENVEVQYNTTIDRAVFSWDNTIIKANTKIDNLVYIAHGVKVGENSLVAAHAAIMGSSTIGENCWIGPNSTISNGIIVEKNSRVNLGAVVTKNISEGMVVSGNFAIDHSKFLQIIKLIR